MLAIAEMPTSAEIGKALYEESRKPENYSDRWQRLRKRLRFNTLLSYWQLAAGWTWMILIFILMIVIWANGGGLWLAMSAWTAWNRWE